MPLKLNIGDIVELKKNHPCGGKTFEIMRAGMDFRIRCLQCGSQNLLIKILISRFLFLFFNISKKTAHLCQKNRHRFLYRRTPVFRRNHGRNRERSSPTV